MQRFDRRSWRPPIYKITHACLITSAMLLLGCDIHKSELKCEDTIEAYDKHGNKIRKRLSRKEYFKKTNARTKKKGTKASNKRVSKKRVKN